MYLFLYAIPGKREQYTIFHNSQKCSQFLILLKLLHDKTPCRISESNKEHTILSCSSITECITSFPAPMTSNIIKSFKLLHETSPLLYATPRVNMRSSNLTVKVHGYFIIIGSDIFGTHVSEPKLLSARYRGAKRISSR